MTENQQKFFRLLANFPTLETYWDKAQKELGIEALEKILNGNILSSGEDAVARWLGGLWLGENKFNFDIFYHRKKFDDKADTLFNAWVNDTFYP